MVRVYRFLCDFFANEIPVYEWYVGGKYLQVLEGLYRSVCVPANTGCDTLADDIRAELFIQIDDCRGRDAFRRLPGRLRYRYRVMRLFPSIVVGYWRSFHVCRLARTRILGLTVKD